MADKNYENVQKTNDKKAQNVQMRGTLASRLINPELFVRPNKVVMGIGLILLTGCVVCLAFINSDQSPSQTPVKTQATGTPKKSKWD